VIEGIFCSACAEKKAFKASAVTWLLGWWGVPWGLVYSPYALFVNMIGGKRPALANARLAAHQAWYFAASGRPDIARAVALDAMNLARKIPKDSSAIRRKKALGYAVDDDGKQLRAQIQALLDVLGGNGYARFKDAWAVVRRPFFVQATAAVAVVGGLTMAIANAPATSYTPPRGPKPYLAVTPLQATTEESTTTPVSVPAQNRPSLPRWEQNNSTVAGAATAQSSWVRPVVAPNGLPWPSFASYLSGYPRANSEGLCTVTVDNGQNDSDVFVKLVSLNGQFAKPVRLFFIPARGRFTIENVTAGTYDVRYENLDTGFLSRSEQFTLQEITAGDGVRYSALTLTLYKVVNGNMRTYDLARDEF
jgi:hypothetical protein